MSSASLRLAQAEQPPQDPAEITDEGVPDEAVEASQGVTEVEEAMEKVEEEIEEGLPAEFTIQFGDTHDWIQADLGRVAQGEAEANAGRRDRVR